jgi:hypothetical protein
MRIADLLQLASYTLADVTRITGAKRRSVQLWAEAGAIQADKGTERGGSGVHRTFTRDEAIIACILNELSQWAVSIGRLCSVGTLLRVHLQGRTLGSGRVGAEIRSAARQERRVFVALFNDGIHIIAPDGKDATWGKEFLGGFGPDSRGAVVISLNEALRNLPPE